MFRFLKLIWIQLHNLKSRISNYLIGTKQKQPNIKIYKKEKEKKNT